MSYCLNPDCQRPQNPEDTVFCQSCGSKLQLKDRYDAIALLGEGGFGRTFIAEDLDRLKARCVIKQFLPLSQVQQNPSLLEKATEMFAQEARQLLQLGDHPQIPTLLADFEQDGRLYLIQEFIDGQNLLQELEEKGAFSADKIESLVQDLLPVLKYIHDRGVIHRDIKPENIIRRRTATYHPGGRSGQLVLIDFGVAKQLTGSVLVKTGTKIGTEGYAPIEQLRGGKAYPASDLYSLGVTCIHLLTDITPDELYDPMNGRWLWRSHLLENGIPISDRLGNLLDKLLQEWVSDRYQSADEAIQDLAWQLPALSTINSPLNVPASTAVIPQRWKCVHTLSGHSSYVISVVISADGKNIVSCSYDKTIKVWHLENGNLLGTLKGHTGWVSCLAISPNGKILASGSLDNTLKLWDLGSGNPVRSLTGHTGYVISLAITPDGQTLIAGCFDNNIKLWDLNRGTLIGTLSGHTGYVECVAIAPDGKMLASGGGLDDRAIHLWNLTNGSAIATLKGHSASVRSIAFTPDGMRLISASEDKTIKIWDITSQQEIETLRHQSGWIQSIALSPNGQILASGSQDSSIDLWDLGTGQLLYTLKWHSAGITALAFSPNGQRLVSSSRDSTIKIWQAE